MDEPTEEEAQQVFEDAARHALASISQEYPNQGGSGGGENYSVTPSDIRILTLMSDVGRAVAAHQIALREKRDEDVYRLAVERRELEAQLNSAISARVAKFTEQAIKEATS